MHPFQEQIQDDNVGLGGTIREVSGKSEKVEDRRQGVKVFQEGEGFTVKDRVRSCR